MLNSLFVHLGPAKADHLFLNIDRHRSLFPDRPVHLVVDNEQLITKARAEKVPVTIYSATESQNELLESMNHDTKFRQGFWRYTIERLFAISFFHEKYPDAGILHIESDVLLLPSFPFEELESCEKIRWMTYNKTHDVSALLYSPNLNQSQWLVEHLMDELSKNLFLTDMTALSTIRRNNPNLVENFTNIKEAFDKGSEEAFDSAAIGMWLCGQDPRSHYGILKLHNNGEFNSKSIDFNPASFKYMYTSEKGLQITHNSMLATVHCLHIHSKSLKMFDVNWESELKKYIELSENASPISQYSFKLFLSLIRQNIEHKTLFPFLAGLPYIYRLRMKLRKLKAKKK